MGTRCGQFGGGIPEPIDRGNDAASGISTRLWCCKWCVKGVVSDSNCEFAAISLIGSTGTGNGQALQGSTGCNMLASA